MNSPHLDTFLESIPTVAFLLDADRRIFAGNSKGLAAIGADSYDKIYGGRLGDLLGCVNALAAPEGCGSGDPCQLCGAFRSMTKSLAFHQIAGEECRIRTEGADGLKAYEFDVQCTYIEIEGEPYTIIALSDISSVKRRQVLERVFFHDLINTAGGIRGLAEFVTEEEDALLIKENSRAILHLSDHLIEEIQAQRYLLAAERSELKLRVSSVDLPALIQETLTLYRHHQTAEGRQTVAESSPDIRLRTDEALLRRILGNLLKNALEATAVGGTVRVTAREMNHGAEVRVINPGVIPPDIQYQLFQRSFSTKEGFGRGVGTYSAKLFGEKYLKGSLSFISGEEEQTQFIIRIPDLPTL